MSTKAKKQKRKKRRKKRRSSRKKSDFDSKIISIRRVTRVVAGGRRFNFSVAMVVGNGKGSVGIGTGKAGDTALAIEKSSKAARKNMIKLKLTKEGSIPFDVKGKHTGSEVVIVPTPGKGLSAGSSVRHVLNLAGINDVTAKLISRSKNKLNNAKAAIKALKKVGFEPHVSTKDRFNKEAKKINKDRDNNNKSKSN